MNEMEFLEKITKFVDTLDNKPKGKGFFMILINNENVPYVMEKGCISCIGMGLTEWIGAHYIDIVNGHLNNDNETKH